MLGALYRGGAAAQAKDHAINNTTSNNYGIGAVMITKANAAEVAGAFLPK